MDPPACFYTCVNILPLKRAFENKHMIRTTMNPLDWTLLIGLSILWGGSFFFIEIVVKSVPPLTLGALRVSLAAVFLWCAVAVLRLNFRVPRRVWVAFLVMGLLNNAIPFTLLASAQLEIASALAAILNATTPLFTVLVAAIFLSDEKPSGLKILGVFIGFFGVVIMIGADMVGPQVLGATLVAIFAQLACLVAAVSYAFAGAFGRRFNRYGVHPILTATGQLTASSFILWPLALYYDGVNAGAGVFDLTPLLSMLGLAVASTALAYVIYFKLLASVGSTNLLLVTFLVPVTAAMLGILVLGERLGLSDVVGMTFIGIGLSAIDGRLWRR